jgi:chemotaxis methyl-accepting protein methylase
MDDSAFRRLLSALDLSWPGYRKVRKGAKKRVARHMQALGCPTIDEYLAVLDADPASEAACRRHLTVSISRFFRDRGLWQWLSQTLPEMARGIAGKEMRVLSAGCASGEEAYSFRMLWEDLREAGHDLPDLHLTGIDMNPDYLDRARKGRYPRSSLREVPDACRERYFNRSPGGKRYRVKAVLREEIGWHRQDLLAEGPDSGPWHLIFLRNNLLTYCRPALARPALERIVERLAPGGLLIVGSHESPPEDLEGMVPAEWPPAYRKTGSRHHGPPT